MGMVGVRGAEAEGEKRARAGARVSPESGGDGNGWEVATGIEVRETSSRVASTSAGRSPRLHAGVPGREG